MKGGSVSQSNDPIYGGECPSDKKCTHFPLSRKGRCGRTVATSGSVRRSAKIRSIRSQLLGEILDSSAMSGATNSSLRMISDLGSTYSAFVLNSLPSAEFCQLARNTSFVFSNIELDTEYIRSRKIESARSVGL